MPRSRAPRLLLQSAGAADGLLLGRAQFLAPPPRGLLQALEVPVGVELAGHRRLRPGGARRSARRGRRARAHAAAARQQGRGAHARTILSASWRSSTEIFSSSVSIFWSFLLAPVELERKPRRRRRRVVHLHLLEVEVRLHLREPVRVQARRVLHVLELARERLQEPHDFLLRRLRLMELLRLQAVERVDELGHLPVALKELLRARSGRGAGPSAAGVALQPESSARGRPGTSASWGCSPRSGQRRAATAGRGPGARCPAPRRPAAPRRRFRRCPPSPSAAARPSAAAG